MLHALLPYHAFECIVSILSVTLKIFIPSSIPALIANLSLGETSWDTDRKSLIIPGVTIGGGTISTTLLTSNRFLNLATRFAKERTEPLAKELTYRAGKYGDDDPGIAEGDEEESGGLSPLPILLPKHPCNLIRRFLQMLQFQMCITCSRRNIFMP